MTSKIEWVLHRTKLAAWAVGQPQKIPLEVKLRHIVEKRKVGGEAEDIAIINYRLNVQFI